MKTTFILLAQYESAVIDESRRQMGRTIPQVASVSGHRTWNSLKRYTHIRQGGDRWAGWPGT